MKSVGAWYRYGQGAFWAICGAIFERPARISIRLRVFVGLPISRCGKSRFASFAKVARLSQGISDVQDSSSAALPIAIT